MKGRMHFQEIVHRSKKKIEPHPGYCNNSSLPHVPKDHPGNKKYCKRKQDVPERKQCRICKAQKTEIFNEAMKNKKCRKQYNVPGILFKILLQPLHIEN